MEQSKTSAGISAESAAKARSEISTTRRYFADMLILMAVPAVMAWYYYGGRAVRLMVFSVLTAVFCEVAGSFIFKIRSSVSDLSAVAAGLMTALCLPASAPYYLPCIASAFAVIAAKLPFGNARSHMFTPAAAGIAFVTICMPDKYFLIRQYSRPARPPFPEGRDFSPEPQFRICSRKKTRSVRVF